MESTVLKVDKFSAFFGEAKVLKEIDLSFREKKATAIIGPSGCGKTTLIRCINRMHELIPDTHVSGSIRLYKDDLYKMQPEIVRRKIGMVFQRPNPFPTMNIYDNVISGYKLNGIKLAKTDKDQIVEESLRRSALWDEVKDRLYKNGSFLSGGQQQRLCIARALAMRPEILLLDEATSALDPMATQKIEELIQVLKKSVTIIMVTHNIGQAARISDYTAFLYLGDLIEYGDTNTMFTTPKDKKTEEYLTGRFG